ncbi:MAG TPA: hypothetical protein VGY58_21620 [Gemmataceae bacterium]|jgi:hypothetical protein|nr:hypothetical protein [Gemmataceae bacterium]
MGDYPGGLILIITGTTLRAEQMDRPLAYYLQNQIDELGAGHDDRLALVISDRYYLTHPDLHGLPTISVGGPGVNRLTQRLLKKLPAALAADGKFFIQMDPDDRDLRVSIWGMDNPQTRIAVVTFAERYLAHFVNLCWQRQA